MCEEEYFFVKIKKLILILTISKLCREFVEKAISRRQKYFSGEMSSSKNKLTIKQKQKKTKR
jgi:hypothetical protein